MSRVLEFLLVVALVPVLCVAQDSGASPPAEADSTAIVSPPTQLETYCRSLSVANGSPNLLTDVCLFAVSGRRRFPDFICEQTTERRVLETNQSDLITASIAYADGHERYSDVRVNGKPTSADLIDVGGFISRGEFASALQEIFDPRSKTQFFSARETALKSKPAWVFHFKVARENSRWVHRYSRRPDEEAFTSAYHGRLWINKTSGHVMRLEQTADFGPSVPSTGNTIVVDYSDVTLEGRGSFTLPQRTSVAACPRNRNKSCFRNETRFENCRKFTVNSRLLPAE